MARVIRAIRGRTDGVTTADGPTWDDWFSATEQQTGDYILLALHNDGGGTAVSCTDWTETGDAQASIGGTRTVLFHKKHAGTTIDEPTIAGANDEWACVRVEIATELARIDENVSAAKTLTAAYDAAKTAASQATADADHDATQSAIAGLNNISAANVETAVGAALATYDPPTKAEIDSAIDTLPTASENAAQVRTELTPELGRIDAAITTRTKPSDLGPLL